MYVKLIELANAYEKKRTTENRLGLLNQGRLFAFEYWNT